MTAVMSSDLAKKTKTRRNDPDLIKIIEELEQRDSVVHTYSKMENYISPQNRLEAYNNYKKNLYKKEDYQKRVKLRNEMYGKFEEVYGNLKKLCYNYIYKENNVKEEEVLDNLEEFINDIYDNQKFAITYIEIDNLINMIEIVKDHNKNNERIKYILNKAEKYKESVEKVLVPSEVNFKKEKNYDAEWLVDLVKEIPIYNRICKKIGPKQRWENVIDKDPDRFLKMISEKNLNLEQLLEIKKVLKIMKKDRLVKELDYIIDDRRIIKGDLGSTAMRIRKNPKKFIEYLSVEKAKRVYNELTKLFYQTDAKKVEEDEVEDLLNIYLDEIARAIENSNNPEAQKLAELLYPTEITRFN